MKSACRAEGVEFCLDFDDFCDHVTPDDLNRWNAKMADDEGGEAKKKKP